jgi:hypothetical protein
MRLYCLTRIDLYPEHGIRENFNYFPLHPSRKSAIAIIAHMQRKEGASAQRDYVGCSILLIFLTKDVTDRSENVI